MALTITIIVVTRKGITPVMLSTSPKMFSLADIRPMKYADEKRASKLKINDPIPNTITPKGVLVPTYLMCWIMY